MCIRDRIRNQHSTVPQQRSPQPTVKLEKVADVFETVSPLLVLEEKLVELMLKYGDRILDRKDQEDHEYQITVIEEIIAHLEEDGYVVQSLLNQKIIEEIKIGIAENELRSGDFFKTLMDENVAGLVVNALLLSLIHI